MGPLLVSADYLLDILGYRQWAFETFDRLTHFTAMADWSIKWCQKLEDTRGGGGKLTVALGWSEMIPEAFYTERPVLVVHPSPLPKYRGGSPIQHQIMAGELVSAVTIFKLDPAYPEVDSGPIGWSHAVNIDGDLAKVLQRIGIVAGFGIEDMCKAYRAWWDGGEEPAFRPQDDREATVFRRRREAESEITEHELKTFTARHLHDKIRALQDPYPNAWIRAGDGRRLYITGTHLDSLEGQ